MLLLSGSISLFSVTDCLFQYKVNLPCCKATFGVCDLYFTSDLDLTSVPNQSANQTTSSGDGYFASIFDCLLVKLQEEILSKSDMYSISSVEDFRPALVHSHLLAGLLGENPEGISAANVDGNVDNDMIEVPDTPECNKKSYRRLKPDHSHVPLLSRSISTLITSLRSVTCEETLYVEDMGQFTNREVFPSPHADKPEGCLKPPEDVSSISCDADVLIDVKEVANDNLIRNDIVKTGLNKLETDLKPVTDAADVSWASLNVSMDNSFFQQLEDISVGEIAKQDVDDNVELDRSTESEELHKAFDKYEVSNEPTNCGASGVDITKLRTLKGMPGSCTKQLHTPLRHRNENTPAFLQSPFVRKIPTDRVTKRRARRKKKLLVKDVDKENNESAVVSDGIRMSEGFDGEISSSSDMQ